MLKVIKAYSSTSRIVNSHTPLLQVEYKAMWITEKKTATQDVTELTV